MIRHSGHKVACIDQNSRGPDCIQDTARILTPHTRVTLHNTLHHCGDCEEMTGAWRGEKEWSGSGSYFSLQIFYRLLYSIVDKPYRDLGKKKTIKINIGHICTLRLFLFNQIQEACLMKIRDPLSQCLVASRTEILRYQQKFKMRLMRALKCDASKGELSLEDVSIPEVILPDDIVIKVGYAGLCGTDLHIMQGEFAVCGSSKVVESYNIKFLLCK